MSTSFSPSYSQHVPPLTHCCLFFSLTPPFCNVPAPFSCLTLTFLFSIPPLPSFFLEFAPLHTADPSSPRTRLSSFLCHAVDQLACATPSPVAVVLCFFRQRMLRFVLSSFGLIFLLRWGFFCMYIAMIFPSSRYACFPYLVQRTHPTHLPAALFTSAGKVHQRSLRRLLFFFNALFRSFRPISGTFCSPFPKSFFYSF